MTTSRLHPFACPVCGRAQALSERAMRRIEQGARSGECRPGSGCRAEQDKPERRRRWWLRQAGVPERAIRAAGGAVAFVAEFGLPQLIEWPRVSLETDRLLRHASGSSVRPDTSHLATYAFRQASEDPLLAVWIAVEMLARGVPAHDRQQTLAEAA